MPEAQRRMAVLLTRRTSKQTEILTKKSAQNSMIWLIKLYRPISAIDSSSRAQTWRPFPCLTPTMLRALRMIVSIAATMIVQSSAPGDFLRAQSRSAVVIALGAMKNAAGMRRTLPILSSVAQGNGEAIVVPKVRITNGPRSGYQVNCGHDDKWDSWSSTCASSYFCSKEGKLYDSSNEIFPIDCSRQCCIIQYLDKPQECV